MKQSHILVLSSYESLLLESSDSFQRHKIYSTYLNHLTIFVFSRNTKKPIHVGNLSVIPITGNLIMQLVKCWLLFRSIELKNPISLISAQDPMWLGLIGSWFKKPLNIQIHRKYSHWLVNYVLKKADTIFAVMDGLVPKEFVSKTHVIPIHLDLSLLWRPARYRPKINRLLVSGESNVDLSLFEVTKLTSKNVNTLHSYDAYIRNKSDSELWCVQISAAGLPIIDAEHVDMLQHPEEVYRMAKNRQMEVKQNLESSILPKLWVEGWQHAIR